MRLSLARPFALSCTLHVLLGVAVQLPLVFEPQRSVAPVITLVADALASSVSSEAPADTVTAVKFTVPAPPRRTEERAALDHTTRVQTREAPKVPEPPAASRAAEASAPAPASRPRQSTPPAPKATAGASHGEAMSLAEFRRKHGAPPSTPARQPQSSGQSHPRVSESFAPAAGTSRPAKLEDQGFGARLLGDLRAAFVSPGVGEELSATVTFIVEAGGRIRRVRISYSSGSAEFDAAVLAAFEHVRAQGFAPGDVGQLFEVTFAQRGK